MKRVNWDVVIAWAVMVTLCLGFWLYIFKIIQEL